MLAPAPFNLKTTNRIDHQHRRSNTINTSYNVNTAERIEHVLSRATWRLIDWLETRIERMRRESGYLHAQVQLESLEDHQLRDLGIRRTDIALVVRGEMGRRSQP